MSVAAVAQDITDLRKIDSLSQRLSQVKTDTARLSILLKLGASYAWTDNKKALEVNNEAAQLAQKLNQPHKIALAYKNSKDYYEYQSDTLNWKKGIEKILNLGNEINDNQILGMGNFEMAMYLWRKKPADSEAYFKKAVEYYKKTNNKDQRSNLYLQFGFYYQSVFHDYNKALSYYQSARNLFDKDDFGLVTVYNAMGTIYSAQTKYKKVLEYGKLEEALYKKNNKTDSRFYDILLNRMGDTYKELKDYDKALEYFTLFYEVSEKKENYFFTSGSLINLADVYLKMKDFGSFDKTIELAEKTILKVSNCNQRATMYNNLGELYSERGIYPNALKFYSKAYGECPDSGPDNNNLSLSAVHLGETYLNLAKHPEHNATGIFKNKNALLEESKKYLGRAKTISSASGNLSRYAATLNLLAEVNELQGNKADALSYLKEYYTLRDSIRTIENRELLVQNQMQFDFEQKEKIQKAEQNVKDALAREALNKEKNRRNLALIGVGIFLLLFGFAGYAYSLKKRDNKIISQEKQKSENLLLNILPSEIAQELKEKGNSEPRYYESVSIMFTDFQDFTKLSEKISPDELIRELNYCFKAFDEIISKHEIEKIKTIGDSYMAVCGLPVKTKDHAKKIIQAAFEMRDFIENYKLKRMNEGKSWFEMRIGINSGEVVAGIVGIKKFAYDIWGDSVNTASRMESNGKIGKINISETSWELVKDDFSFEYRGKIETKGKGEVSMYFAEPKSDNGRFEKLKNFILNELSEKLSPNLYYHDLNHVLDVYDSAIKYSKLEKVSDEDCELIKIAALFHDSGYMIRAEGHEELSCRQVEKYLPDFGYSDDEIQKITAMIMATKIPQNPKSHLEKILSDADLDYLGRNDFDQISNKLFLELKYKNENLTNEEWDKIQVSFFENHNYFTDSAKSLRNEKKNENLQKIKNRLK